MTKFSLLVIDDDPDVLLSAQLLLESRGFKVRCQAGPNELGHLLRSDCFDLVLLDMNFVKGERLGHAGLHHLKQIRQIAPETAVVMMTAYEDTSLAVCCMKEGATDFVVKPWENEKLVATLTSACRLAQGQRNLHALQERQEIFNRDLDRPFRHMIGTSPAMQEVYRIVDKVAATDANVLILGENGTGKELVARELHKRSQRTRQPFITVDMGAIHEALFESELFGHKRGAFTDAKNDRPGRFQAASGGTLFMDELGNLSHALQGKLLSALQQRQVTPLGSNKPINVDVRLISATNLPLYEMVEAQTFRQDLLYRVNTVEIHLPPLREREGDVEILADHFLNQLASKYRKPNLRFAPDTLKRLRRHRWPGNVRELQHAVERAVIMADGPLLRSEDFPLRSSHPPTTASTAPSLNIKQVTGALVRLAMEKHGGNISRAAKELGITRNSLYRRLAEDDC